MTNSVHDGGIDRFLMERFFLQKDKIAGEQCLTGEVELFRLPSRRQGTVAVCVQEASEINLLIST